MSDNRFAACIARALLAATFAPLVAVSVAPAFAAPEASLSRSTVDFGTIPAGYLSSIQPVFVTNTGDSPLTISGMSIGGANAMDFSVAGTCTPPTILPVNSQCRLEFRMLAPGVAHQFGALSLQSDSSPAPPDIMLTGTLTSGSPYEPPNPTPAWVDFSSEPVGGAASPQTMTLTNLGEVDFHIDSIGLTGGDTGDFSLLSTCVPGGTLAAGTNCAATIGFTPSASGPRSVELQLALSVGSDMGNYFFSITGVGGAGAAPDLNQHGLTGSWYDAADSGQGVEVEVFPDAASGTGSTFVSWFTYDTVAGGEDAQRWYTAQGPVVTGQANASLTIYQNTGGNFNAPPATTAREVGAATLSFSTCTSGQLAYSFTDGSGRMGNIPLTRLTQNVTCSTTTPYPTNADFAFSGNWYGGAATSGQGFTAEVNPNSATFFAAWYTYEPMGAAAGAAGQRWYTAQASFTAGMRSIPVTIYETTGGVFNMPPPAGQKTVPVGSGTMAFQSCTAATFSYNFTAGSSSGLSGTIALSRVGPVPPGCTS